MTGRAARLKDSSAILRSRRASEDEHQPENTCKGGDQDSHLTSVEV
jgi:hypothetical protein